jgi:hypothetical protein
MLDFSRFDMHVSVEQLRATHGLYLRLIRDPEFQRLLDFRVDNFGSTASGIRFRCRGRRMSGDMDTASGNSVIALSMIRVVARLLRLRRWDVLCDGDDCLLFLDQAGISEVQRWIGPICNLMGHEIDVGCVARQFNQIEFCQCKPIELDSGWTMVRNPRKAVSWLAASHKHYGQPGGLRVLKSIAMCELACSSGVPVVQAYCLRLIELLGDVRCARLDVTEDALIRLRAWLGKDANFVMARAGTISDRVRSAFSETFGMDEGQQVALERQFGSISRSDLDLTRMRCYGDVWLATKSGGLVGNGWLD